MVNQDLTRTGERKPQEETFVLGKNTNLKNVSGYTGWNMEFSRHESGRCGARFCEVDDEGSGGTGTSSLIYRGKVKKEGRIV